MIVTKKLITNAWLFNNCVEILTFLKLRLVLAEYKIMVVAFFSLSFFVVEVLFKVLPQLFFSFRVILLVLLLCMLERIKSKTFFRNHVPKLRRRKSITLLNFHRISKSIYWFQFSRKYDDILFIWILIDSLKVNRIID